MFKTTTTKKKIRTMSNQSILKAVRILTPKCFINPILATIFVEAKVVNTNSHNNWALYLFF
jgi:hypothetical protein